MVNQSYLIWKEIFFFCLIDKQQSPGAIARSASANELALRKKNHLLSKIQSGKGHIDRLELYFRSYDTEYSIHSW